MIDVWTRAKSDTPEKNEDRTYFDDGVAILADGATDKTGLVYPSGKTGGRELAELAVHVASRSERVGYDLADEITRAVQDFYRENNPEALNDPSKRAATTLVVARTIGDELVVTQIADTNIRLTRRDGRTEVFTNDKLIDSENAGTRAEYIRSHIAAFNIEYNRAPEGKELDSIVAGGRDAIQERLNTQYIFQNNADEPIYGSGVIDGQIIPREFSDGTPTNFVKKFRFPIQDIAKIELVSDGFYGEFPQDGTVESYRALYDRIQESDPYKYLRYLSTKPRDDATVVIRRF